MKTSTVFKICMVFPIAFSSLLAFAQNDSEQMDEMAAPYRARLAGERGGLGHLRHVLAGRRAAGRVADHRYPWLDAEGLRRLGRL